MNRLSGLAAAFLIGAASLAAYGAAAQANSPAKPVKKGNWNATVTEVNGGHLIGNPEAEARLVEFMSYTCSHCANFAKTGDGAIKLLYVPTGKVAYEIRHLIRDPVDLTAALAAQCGDATKFPGNHEMLILKHDEWMDKARNVSRAQLSRWNFGTWSARAQAIASDLGFYEIMASRGFTRAQLDHCLTDEAKAKKIDAQSQADVAEFALKGTPTFFMGGEQLDVNTWAGIQPLLDKHF